MYKHIVCWEFAEKNKGSNLEAMKLLLEALPVHIPEILELEVGLNVKDSPRVMDMVLSTSFADEAAYQVYATHPAHGKVVEALHKVTVEAVIVDYNTME